MEFPGVVPRTFLGAIVVSFFSMPAAVFVSLFRYNKFIMQYVARFVLSVLCIGALLRFLSAIEKELGGKIKLYTALLCCTQFHFLFYISRTLPNIFALIPALVSLSFWIENKHVSFIWTSAFAIVIFRSELALLLGLCLLINFVDGKITLKTIFLHGFSALCVWLALTVTVDSVFWQYLVWPEGRVFYYNTFLNKSSKWGTFPFLWYFYSALPRALGPSLVLVPLGIYLDARVKRLLMPVFGFISFYSMLPHKELRFIIYAIPVLNVATARVWNYVAINIDKSWKFKISLLFIHLMILGNIVLTIIILYASSFNYSGGLALARFHRYVSFKADVNLYIDNYPCQSGVTRFGELHGHWRYNKSEYSKSKRMKALQQYTHLLMGYDSEYSALKDTHNILFSVRGFKDYRVNLDWKAFPWFLEVVQDIRVVALQRKDYKDGSAHRARASPR